MPIIKRALISVANKTGLIEFGCGLQELGVEIIATDGTAKALTQANIAVTKVATITGFPAIMDGRVKTLHPKIVAAILGKRDTHAKEALQHDIAWIDLVVCNLYPFAASIKRPAADLALALENIDIGGSTMLRAAAKNFQWVSVVVDPNDYTNVLLEMQQHQELSEKFRKLLAAKAFAYTAQYDALIAKYFTTNPFPDQLILSYNKIANLCYGENPHQKAAVYHATETTCGVLDAIKHQGKQLSFNNLLDTNHALLCLQEFSSPTCVIVKHNNPCSVATHADVYHAFINAWKADSLSAFGGVIAINRTCSPAIAEQISNIFIEVLIAPGYEPEALKILNNKPNLRILEVNNLSTHDNYTIKGIDGGLLMTETDNKIITAHDCKLVTKTQIADKQLQDLLFAARVAKHVRSNAIVIASNLTTLGIGHGQVSRIEAVNIALNKGGNNLQHAVLASDGFFPFRDSIDRISSTKLNAIIQPGGSIRDQEVINACDEYGIAMIFTGIRSFCH
jgi:phosphoribosylaminoimidazolecarboxamide formyltransferase / IMP cyclohydrolase